MITAIIRYIISAVIDIAADILAFILAPIAAMFIERIDGREHIRPFWSWITTHDAPVDEYFMGSYFKRGQVLARYTRDQIRNSAFLSYVGRILWIWRNPAYQVSHWLGYDQTGVDTTRGLYKDERWDTGVPNKAFWKVVNDKGQVGFLYQRQAYWGKTQRCVEIQFGWKLYRRDPDKKCMLAFRISPFKKY